MDDFLDIFTLYRVVAVVQDTCVKVTIADMPEDARKYAKAVDVLLRFFCIWVSEDADENRFALL